MKAYPQTLQEIFEGDVHYVIPDFQRPYRWTKEDQWKPLWQDLSKMAEYVLEEESEPSEFDHLLDEEGPEPIHFFGAIVIKEAGKQTPTSPTRWTVIDGQQRLTTLQLLMAAARSAFDEIDSDARKGIEPLLVNSARVYSGNRDYKHKLYLLHRDRAPLRAVLDGDHIDPQQDSAAVGNCYSFFYEEIGKWLRDAGTRAPMRAEALETVMRFHFNVVLLALDRQENEYVIYETLNARGTPLLAWDHIKSFMLNRASEEGHSEESANALIGEEANQFTDDWWEREIGSGYARRSRVDAFLGYWLTMKLKRQVETRRASRLAREFQGFVDGEGKHGTILDVAEELGVHSVAYMEMEEPTGDDRLSEFFTRWRTMNAGVLTPVLMWLRSEVTDNAVQERAFVAIESYLVRRMMCGLGTRGYFDVMLGLLKSVDAAGTSRADQAVMDYLSEQESPRRSWPRDEEFLRELAREGQYGRAGVANARLTMVLKALDDSMRSSRTDQEVSWPKVNIEHLMPQRWEECYPLESAGSDRDEDPEQRRQRLLHAIGNLTLVTPSFNSSVSNKCWPVKRKELERFAASALNRDILSNSADDWTEADIVARGLRLGEVALRVWPGPEKT